MANVKKLAAAFVVAAIAALFVVGTAFAAGTGSITISNTQENNVYKVYKVFDANGNGTSIRYTVMDGKTGVPAGFSVDSAGNVTGPDSLSAQNVADIAAYVKGDTPVATATAEGDTVTLSGLPNGYYYITTTTGTCVTVTTTNPNATCKDKNDKPSVDKTVKDPTVQVGQNAEFTITVKAQKGAQNYVVHDEMTEGLTFNNDVAIAGLTKGTDYTVATSDLGDDCDFHVVFTKSYLDKIAKETTIEITYTALVNEKAVTVDPQTNKTSLDYGEKNHTTVITKNVTTTYFNLEKVDGATKAALTGAKFKLYANGAELAVVKDGDYYRPALKGETGVEIEAGTATVKGLDEDITYTLEETVAPDGYNLLTEKVSVKLKAMNTVENNAGATLPSTGGMGTTIFYLVGAVLVIGAVVVLIARRRVRD